MLELEPEVPRRARLVFMIGGGLALFALVIILILIGKTPEPSQPIEGDPLPPIQQRYNVDPLRPRPATPTSLPATTPAL